MTWWADNDTIPNPNTTANFNATPKFNTLYVATAFYNGCTVSDSLRVYVTPLPVNAGADTVICDGTTLALQGNTIFGANYLWSPAGAVDTTTSASTNFIANQNTTLYYTVNRLGCSNTDTLNIEVEAAPQAEFTYFSSLLSLDVDFTHTAIGYDSLSWNFGDGTTDTTENPTHSYAQNGFYTPCLYVYNACGTDTICHDVDLTIVGLQALSNKTTLQREQNGFIISQNKVISNFILYDMAGRKITQNKSNANRIELDLTAIPQGCYLLELNCEGEKQVLKLMW